VGAITSYYVDAGYVCHGFERARDDRITRFDVPGAGTGAWQGTFPVTNNAEGAITGHYVEADGVYRGFLRPAVP
jgi:hypothetical protein